MVLKRLAVLPIALILFFSSCKNIHNISSENVNRVQKDSLVTMTEHGDLQAINAQLVKAPSYWNVEYRIIYLIPEGKSVNKGDTLVKFDPTPVKEQLESAKARFALARQKLIQIKEENALHLRKQKETIRSMQMQFSIDSARLADAIYESEAVRQNLALELKKSALELKKARKKLAALKIINQAKYHLQSVEVEHALSDVKRISEMLQGMNLIAAQTGIAIHGNVRGQSGAIREGETVYPGQMVMQVADLSQMKAVLMVNEVDREAIKIGQKVRLIVNAYPDTTFTGTIRDISKIADLVKEDGTVKAYETVVYMDGQGNYRLKPGLSVRATVITDTLHHVFKIPEWCLKHSEKGWYVQGLSGQVITVEPVRLNNGFVFVKGALKKGLVLEN